MAFGLCKEATKLANTIPMLKVANSKAVRSDHRWQSVRHNMKSGNTIAKEQNEKGQTAITDGSEAQEAIWSRRRKFCQFPAIIHNLKDCSGYMVRPRHHHHHHHSHHGWSLNTSADDQSQVIVIIVRILIYGTCKLSSYLELYWWGLNTSADDQSQVANSLAGWGKKRGAGKRAVGGKFGTISFPPSSHSLKFLLLHHFIWSSKWSFVFVSVYVCVCV